MEENNRKGPGVFYAVVGVATLVVAIIGATFAYFSASAPNTGEQITGGTNNDLASALSLSATEVTWSDAGVTSHNLVPADFGTGEMSLAKINGALDAKCVNKGYTGCHLWKIEANTTQAVASASVLLDLSVDAAVKSNWKYALFTGSQTSATAFPTVKGGTAFGTIGDGITGLDMHNEAAMSAGTAGSAPSNTYYLLIYLENVNKSQNGQSDDNGAGTNETGTYTGTVTMNAAGGKVKATFTARGV